MCVSVCVYMCAPPQVSDANVLETAHRRHNTPTRITDIDRTNLLQADALAAAEGSSLSASAAAHSGGAHMTGSTSVPNLAARTTPSNCTPSDSPRHAALAGAKVAKSASQSKLS